MLKDAVIVYSSTYYKDLLIQSLLRTNQLQEELIKTLKDEKTRIENSYNEFVEDYRNNSLPF